MLKNWWEEDEVVAPQGGGIVTRAADPKLPGELTIQSQTIRQNAGDIGNLPSIAAKAAADARTAEANARIAEATAQSAGQVRAAELDKQDELGIRRANLKSVADQIDTIKGLHETYLKGGFPNWIAGNNPLTPGRQEFNAAGSQLLDIGQAAFRVPGSGDQNQSELQFKLDAYLPQASDTDATIERKLQYLRDRVDQQQKALGQPPIDWNASAKPQGMDRTAQTTVMPNDQGARELSKDGTQSVVDPTLRAVGYRVGKMVVAGKSQAQIYDYLRKNNLDPGADPALAGSINRALQERTTENFQRWKRKNPGKPYPIGEDFYTRKVPLTGLSSTMNAIQQNPTGASIGAGAIAGGQAVTGNRLDELAGAFGGNAEQVRAVSELARAEHPAASFVGDFSGQIAGEAALSAIPGVRAAMAATPWARRGVDLAYGGYAGSGASEGDRLGGMLEGAVFNAAGGAAGRQVQKGVGGAMLGVRDEGLKYLNDRGVNLTLGEIARASDSLPGRAVAWTEDRLAGLPGPDAMVNSARYRGAESFNRAAFTEGAAKPMTETGERGLMEFAQTVDDAYGRALDGVTLKRDNAFETQFRAARTRAAHVPRYEKDLEALVDDVGNLFKGGSIDGKGFQEAMQLIRSTRSEFAGEKGFGRLNKELDALENAVMGIAKRQRRDLLPALAEANKLNANLKIMQRAIKSSPAQRNDALISPLQLNQAAIQNVERFGGLRKALSENRPFYQLSKAGMDAMGQQVPDSGTAGRAALVPLVGAGMIASDQLAGAVTDNQGVDTAGDFGRTLGMLALGSSVPYSKTGQRIIQKFLLANRSKNLIKAGEMLKEHPWLAGVIGSTAGREATLYDQ